ncbi:MAG: energy transducer TonB [Bacteroidetes bacterium]|nr:energy transducer TonB [Bacteroidota bacterium]
MKFQAGNRTKLWYGLFILFISSVSFSQKVIGPDSLGIYTVTEHPPEYPGGVTAMMKFILQKFEFPCQAREQGIGKTPSARFVVEEDGSITHITIPKKSDSPELDQAVIQVISKLSPFKPALHNGKAVRCYVYLPIHICFK